MKQMFSHDAGKTWTKPVELEVGRVLPDLVLMSNGSFGGLHERLLEALRAR